MYSDTRLLIIILYEYSACHFINQSTSGTMFILCHMIDSDQSVKSFWKAPFNIRELCYMVYISLYFFANNGPFIKKKKQVAFGCVLKVLHLLKGHHDNMSM